MKVSWKIINKLTSLIKKTSEEIASLKIDYDKSVSKLNEFKSQNVLG
jgi:tRNA uridine 5-carbamoylmethylation protein Kti12